MKALVTGGSGFIATHCIAALLREGHDVVFTVRSASKGTAILNILPGYTTDQLSFVLVPDIAAPHAFDSAVQSTPPLDAVLHTASPFHFNITNVQTDLLDPAINGTTGILHSIKAHAPSIRHVVITSSFAAMSQPPNKHPPTYNESHWSALTLPEALHSDPFTAYRASKQFAEQAAWDFMQAHSPNFSLTSLTPPAVFGPILTAPSTPDAINTSNQAILALVRGQLRTTGLAPSPIVLWVDVRDLATAHVRALEREGARGQRVFVVAGHYRNAEIVEALRKRMPGEVRAGLPDASEALPREFPFGFDNGRSREVLGLEYRELEESVGDAGEAILRLCK